MRILKTRVNNFQSLGEVSIEHGDFTVLWGASDLGKSAIIRAIRSLHRNTATPEDVRFGKQKLKIVQEFDNGTTVGYEKSKTVNSYSLNDKVFSKIGREVPDQIRESLKTDKLILDKDVEIDLNFSPQFDPPFLLTGTSSLVTKTISSLSGLHYIYAALRDATTQSQRLKTQVQVLQNTIEPLRKFEDLKKESDELLQKMQQLEKAEELIDRKKDEIEILKQYKERLVKIKEIDIGELEILREELFTEIIPPITLLTAQIQQWKQLLDKAKKLKTIDIDGQLTELDTTYNKLVAAFNGINKLKIGYNNLETILNKSKDNLGLIISNSEKLSKLELEEKELRDKIKICPACGRVL